MQIQAVAVLGAGLVFAGGLLVYGSLHGQGVVQAAAAALLILLIGALGLVRSILRSVAGLVGTARELAAGRQVEIPAQDRRDEIGELARALLAWSDLHSEREVKARRLQVVHELALAASGMLDLEALSRLTIDKAAEALGADGGVLVGRGPGSGHLEVLACHPGVAPRRVRPGEGAIGRAFVTRQAVVIDDYQEWAQGAPAEDRWPVRSTVVVPLTVGERAVGALGVAWSRRHRADPADVTLLSLLASQVAPALEAAHLHAVLTGEEERFRTLYQSMACGVAVQSPEGEILDANQAASAILGDELEVLQVTSDPAHRRRLLRVDGGQLPAGQHPTMVVRRTRRAVRDLVVGVVRGPEQVWIQVDSVPIFDSEGELRQIVTSFIDITSHRRADEANRESQAKSRFLAAMSHEVRTPLNSILGFGQLLRSNRFGELNERQDRYLRHIESSSEHLLALINEVLDLSKIEAGQMEVMIEKVGLDPLLADTLARMSPLGHVKGLHLSLQCEGPSLQVRADRRRLQQVLLNLLSNAIKFTPSGGSVELGAREVDGSIEVWVRDTGIGIPPEKHSLVFQDFTQIDGGRTRSQEGTGLGLALSSRLLELMHGEIRLRSGLGEGSSFTVVLPGVEEAAIVNADEEIAIGSER